MQATIKQVSRIWESLLRFPDYAAVQRLTRDEASHLIEEINTRWAEANGDVKVRRDSMIEIARRLCQEKGTT